MRILFYSPGGITKKLKHLDAFIGGRACACVTQATHVVGWGYRPSGKIAALLARRHGLKQLHLEDGLLTASLGLNRARYRLSMMVDSRAPYFDTSRLTDLEVLISSTVCTNPEVERYIERWRQLGLSKYGLGQRSAPVAIQQAHAAGRKVVVLFDQLAGDASLAEALTGPLPFERMIRLAKAAHPDALLVVKKHPREGEKSGRFSRRKGVLSSAAFAKELADAVFCETDVSMAALLPYAHACYTVTSQAGFEALLYGADVTCVGHPWYAGWGLTRDVHEPVRRQGLPRKTLQDVFEAALLKYCRYVHPATGVSIGWDAALAHAELQVAARRWAPAKVAIVDVQSWKRRVYKDFFPGSAVTFVKASEVDSLSQDTALVAWGQRTPQWALDAWRRDGYSVLQCEDGFLRSVGLGCELVRPLSLSFDPQGLYADTRTPSLLLDLVRAPLGPRETQEARQFIRLHRNLKLSKYLGTAATDGVHWRTAQAIAQADRKVVLLCGQVADDVSVKTANCPWGSFEQIAAVIKAEQPDCFLVFRPHPDVLKGVRPGETDIASADHCDHSSPTRALAELAQEVHVINSLSGFEALISEKPVVTWGNGWYAGWGLTQDRIQPPRGTSATLEQLVHAAYFAHPLYYDEECGQFITALVAAEVLSQRQQDARRARGVVPPVLKVIPRLAIRGVAALYRRIRPQ